MLILRCFKHTQSYAPLLAYSAWLWPLTLEIIRNWSLTGSRQANLVFIAYASSEGSGEPAHPRSLARTSAARSYKPWVKRNLQTETQIPGPSEWLGCAVIICHDGMLEDTNSLDGAQLKVSLQQNIPIYRMFSRQLLTLWQLHKGT